VAVAVVGRTRGRRAGREARRPDKSAAERLRWGRQADEGSFANVEAMDRTSSSG